MGAERLSLVSGETRAAADPPLKHGWSDRLV